MKSNSLYPFSFNKNIALAIIILTFTLYYQV